MEPLTRWLATQRPTEVMSRIHVTGNAGVGKSTLAAHIGLALGLPTFGLDEIVWKPGWKKTGACERTTKEQALCVRPSWVIEGVSRAVRESADLIVFLDYPRSVSFWRCAKRNWRYLFRSRPGLPENCPEIRIAPTLVRIIWQFPSKVRPALMADLDEWRESKAVVHIRSDRELVSFLGRLEQLAAHLARSQLAAHLARSQLNAEPLVGYR